MEQGGEQEASGRGSSHCVPHCSACPLQACHPWYRGVRVEAPHPPVNHSQLGWGCSRGTELGHPQVPTGWVLWETVSHQIRLWEAGRTPLQPLSSSCPLPTPPHPPWDGKGSGLTTTAHLTRRQHQSQNPRRPGTLASVGALVQAPVPALWDRKQVIHLPAPCSHL